MRGWISLIAVLGVVQVPQPQTPQSANSTFEVAAIKVNKSGERAGSMRFLPSGQVTVTNMTLGALIRLVYQVEPFQLSGGPGWLDSEHYDILAKAEANTAPPQIMGLMRSLLAERFKLMAHTETRELPVYDLVVAKAGQLGSQLRKAAIETCPPRPVGSLAGTLPDPKNPPCGVLMFGLGQVTGRTVPVAQLASRLTPAAGRKVINCTELNGQFDVDLEFAPDQPTASPNNDQSANPGVSIFTALQEQLGLKLESTRGPVEVLVIDSVQRPTPD